MKKVQFDFSKANARKREIGDRLVELADKLESSELTDDARKAVEREEKDLRSELEVINMRTAAAMAHMAAEQQGPEVTKSRNEVFRELLRDIRSGKRQEREITLGVLNSGDTNNITSAGAVNVTVKDIMPNLAEGLIWGKVGMQVQTGVAGNIVWPYATETVKMEEVGETVALSDQDIDFANVKTNPGEVGATIQVTFASIEDATFDVLTFVQVSYDLATQDFLNWKTFSHASFTGNIKGPWAGKVNATDLVATYRNILDAKADLINTGVNMSGFCYVLDAKAEALLKSTPKADGQGGFIIQNGTLDGDPYFVSHYIRQKADGTMDTNMYLGLGVWQYLAACQHGAIHMTVDPYTLASKGMLKITIRTRWSLTALREEAFACYKLVEAATETETEEDDSDNG